MKYDWVDKNWVPFCRHIEDHTSGSGMDYRYDWSIKGNVIRLKTHFHLMNDDGYYPGNTPVCIWFDMSGKEIDFKVRCNNGNGLREYIEDLFLQCGECLNTKKGVKVKAPLNWREYEDNNSNQRSYFV